MREPRTAPGVAAIDAPPPRVVGAARSAFRDAAPHAERLRPVHDSWDEHGRERALVFRYQRAALVLTGSVVPGGVTITGRALGTPAALAIVVRRPGRPCLRLAAGADRRIGPATMPRGLASIEVEYGDDESTRWQSDWLQL